MMTIMIITLLSIVPTYGNSIASTKKKEQSNSKIHGNRII